MNTKLRNEIKKHLDKYGKKYKTNFLVINELDVLKKLKSDNIEIGEEGNINYMMSPNNSGTLTTHRYLCRRLGIDRKLNSTDLITMSGEINAKFHDPFDKLKTIKGDAIVDAYANGFACSSCMTGHSGLRTRMYAINIDKYTMLQADYCNQKARAMCVVLDNGNIFMDRVYASSGFIRNIMLMYARKKRWWFKEKGNGRAMKSVNQIAPEKELIISGLTYRNGQVPYQDTFRRGMIKNGKLCLAAFNAWPYRISITSTSGTINAPVMYTCVVEGCDHIDVSNQMTAIGNTQYVCNEHKTLYQQCKGCGYWREKTTMKNTSYGFGICQGCASQKWSTCTHCKTFERSEYMIKTEKGILCEDCHDIEYGCEDNDDGDWG
jgi:hypothetical protein